MFGRLLASVLKEMLLFLRDPRSRAMLFGIPVMQVTIFGLAATLEVRHVDLAIINDDAGRWSRRTAGRCAARRTGHEGLWRLSRLSGPEWLRHARPEPARWH